MATETYNINVDTSQAQKAINDLNKSLGQLQQTGNAVAGALGGLFSAAAIKEFTTLSDSVTNLQNKLRLVTQQGQDSTQVFNLMAKTAMNLGAPLQDVGNLFFRIANNTKDLGLKQSEQLRLTELLTKSFMANGLSADEASSAVTQFGQALGRGVLQGDELNSILENAPPIAQAIADKFGVTTGALRELGSQGKITSRDIIDAMMAAGDSIDRDFASRIPTIQNAFNSLNTAISVTIQQFDQSTGASAALSLAILKIANAILDVIDFFQEWGKIISAVAEIFLIGKLYKAISALLRPLLAFIAAGQSFKNVILAWMTPLMNVEGAFAKIGTFLRMLASTFFPNAIAAGNAFLKVLAAIAAFTGVTKLWEGIQGLFSDDQREAATRYQDELDRLNQRLGIDNVQASEQAREATNALTANQLKATEIISKSLSDLQNSYNDFRSSFGQGTANIGLGEEERNRMQGQAEATKQYADAIKKVKEEMAKLGLSGSAEEQKAVNDLRSAYEGQLSAVNQLVAAREREIEAYNLSQFAIQQQISLTGQLTELQTQIAKVGLPELEKKYLDIDAAAQKAAQSAIQAEQARRGGEPLPLEEQQRYYEEATRGAEDLKNKTLELYNATENYTRSLSFTNFATRERVSLESDLQRLQDDIAKVTLPELEKKYYDIEAAARASAKAAIEAEQARRGGEPLPLEEQRQYYAEALKGAEELKAKTEELTIATENYTRAMNFNLYATKEQYRAQDELQKIYDDTLKGSMSDIEKKYYDIGAAARDSANQAIRAEEARRKAPLSMEEQQKYYEEAAKGNEQLKRAAEEQYEASRRFETGWNRAFRAYAENATNAATQAERIFQTVTSNMEDMIVEFAKTGKFEWKGFLDSIVEELLRSQVRQLIAQVFGGIGMGQQQQGGGGGGGLLGGILGFANGGVIPTNKPVLVGERGPELLTGAAGRTVVPNNELGSNVTYNINAVDARSFKEMVAADPSFLYAVTEQGRRKLPGGR